MVQSQPSPLVTLAETGLSLPFPASTPSRLPPVSPLKAESESARYHSQSQSRSQFQSPPAASSSTSNPPRPSKSKSPSTLPSRSERKYKCTFEGCDKAYFKPSRLAEHELSHTGERPHVCPNCGQSYLRATHLTAHLRTHLDQGGRPFACMRGGCDKAFWTSSHLARHEAVHDKAEVYPCEQCDQTFGKAHLLREHIAATHLPEGSKPWPCTHEGCGASFSMKAHLKAHQKTHDPTRYTCSHPSHGSELPSFPVWSALQTHMHQAHPPTCPHQDCHGRVFKTQQRLRDHLKVHAEQEADKAKLLREREEGNGTDQDLPPIIADGLMRRKKRRQSETASVEDGGKSPKLRRVMSGEAGKDWACDHYGCGKKFKSKFAMESHRRSVHLKLRTHVCPVEGCGASYPYMVNLKRHIETHSRPTTPTVPKRGEGQMLTGMVRELRRFGCPSYAFGRAPTMSVNSAFAQPFEAQVQVQVPEVKQEPGAEQEVLVEQMEHNGEEARPECTMRFWRVYDVRRHLKAEHGVELEDMEVRRLLLSTGQTGE
ncbi:hypothetical protein IAR55_004159 [Kwoniella newhampshirensis]|uniref:C2H2-type domain-containing protein n=1 Tax=Kwoniella newhampshirensis TaxID=1651941 RepID=A0AAW0YLP0_9TREE